MNDTIEFTKEPINQEKIKTKVIGFLKYRNFKEMFEDFDISLLGDNSMTKKELIQELEQYYSKDLQSKYSVIGIKVQVLK